MSHYMYWCSILTSSICNQGALVLHEFQFLIHIWNETKHLLSVWLKYGHILPIVFFNWALNSELHVFQDITSHSVISVTPESECRWRFCYSSDGWLCWMRAISVGWHECWSGKVRGREMSWIGGNEAAMWPEYREECCCCCCCTGWREKFDGWFWELNRR